MFRYHRSNGLSSLFFILFSSVRYYRVISKFVFSRLLILSYIWSTLLPSARLHFSFLPSNSSAPDVGSFFMVSGFAKFLVLFMYFFFPSFCLFVFSGSSLSFLKATVLILYSLDCKIPCLWAQLLDYHLLVLECFLVFMFPVVLYCGLR